MSELQQKLTHMKGLLPSQRQWLERLMFQLEFNPYQRIHMVGGPGTGKTTLTLAVADLLSSQFNLALIKAEAELTAARVRQHVLEHWFGVCKDASKPMIQLVGERELPEPLALVIDQAEYLPAELWAELAELPCLVIAATEHPSDTAELNLPLPALGLDDAQILLEGSGLNTLTVADRMDTALGNMHILLDPSLARRQVIKTEVKTASLAKPLWVFSVGMTLIAAVVFFWFWTEQQQQPAGLGELTYLPEEQEVVPATEAPVAMPSPAKAVVEKLVGTLEQVGSKTASSSAEGMAKPVDFAAAEQGQTATTVEPVNESEPVTDSGNTALTAGVEAPIASDSANTAKSDTAQAEMVTTEVPDLTQGNVTSPQPQQQSEQQLASEAELSVAAEMTAELGAPKPQSVAATEETVAEPEEDLAAQAQAELQKSPVTAAPSSGGYAYQESELLSMSGMALQLVVFSNEAALKSFLASEPSLQTYTYQRTKNGQRQLVVVLAPFADAVEAKAQIAALPKALQQAFVKPLADIHSEISIQ